MHAMPDNQVSPAVSRLQSQLQALDMSLKEYEMNIDGECIAAMKQLQAMPQPLGWNWSKHFSKYSR